MFDALKSGVMRVLSVPPEPHVPLGAEGSLRVFRAGKGYYSYRLISWLIGRAFIWLVLGLGAGGIGAFGFGELGDEPLLGGFLLLVSGLSFLALVAWTIVSYVALRLDYELRWYMVTDRSLRIREGVYRVREMTLTFANIQNISATQGPLQRMFGISDLVVQTAGGGGVPQQGQTQQFGMHLGVFRGVDNAEEIRGLMLDRLRLLRDSGLGDEQVEGRKPVSQGSMSAAAIVALRQVRDESRALRVAAEEQAVASTAV